MVVIDRPSPNFGPRRPVGRAVDMLLLHYTGMATGAAALDRLCDPVTQVSSHYTIDEDGTVYRHVAEADRAWHAGESCWQGDRDVNSRSIGIELVNPGHEFGYRPFPEAQMLALIELGRGILTRHPIPPSQVLAHSDVAWWRKQDPGELFDWARLARAGLGVWADGAPQPAEPIADADLIRHLAGFGYRLEQPGDLPGVLAAFQRHYRPRSVTGAADPETAGLVWEICSTCGRPGNRGG